MTLNELKSKIHSILKEELAEMARTAGTGNAVKITQAGKNLLKDLKTGNQPPAGIRKSHIAILAWLLKSEKEGKRVQKIDYAKEIGVQQPQVNSLFNELLKPVEGSADGKGYIESEGYTSMAQTAVPRIPTDYTSMLADLDLEDEPTTPKRKKSK